jgi:hypothetical protein
MMAIDPDMGMPRGRAVGQPPVQGEYRDANIEPTMSLAIAQARLEQAMEQEILSVLVEKGGTDNDTPFGRTQRAAIALQRTLYWLCLRYPDGSLHSDLVALATMLVDCVKTQRLPDPAEMAQWDLCFEGMCAQSDISQDEALGITHDVGGILRDVEACAPLVDGREARGVWTRTGQLVTLLWSHGPFDENGGDNAIRRAAREALVAIVRCDRQCELVGCVAELLHSYCGGGKERDAGVQPFVDSLRLAEVLVSDQHPMAALGDALVFTDSDKFWQPWL